MPKLICAVLLAALAIGCTSSGRQSATTVSVAATTSRPAAPTTARPVPTTTHVSDNPDFKTCDTLNETIQEIVDDRQAGRVDDHTALASVRLALETMRGLDCGQYSSVVAREMANMDEALRSVGY